MTQRALPETRGAYRHFSTLTTRWLDNDAYGHLNNVQYYSFFDTAVNRYLIDAGALDIAAGGVIGLVVQTHCDFFSPLAFPQDVEAGLRVSRIGGASVRYELGLFGAGEPLSAAAGHFIHVYVERSSRKPVALPAALLAALTPLVVTQNLPNETQS
jgi:acyl-CoA thioester hydrolase